VIGAGGLGSFAIQYLKILTKARILVADVAPDKRARAVELGADDVIDGSLENVAGEAPEADRRAAAPTPSSTSSGRRRRSRRASPRSRSSGGMR
jgi:D-arabinose 1-dehydrogenase-like Zn-dependent alcohol dehydrogenase